MYKCWWTNKRANERSIVFVHQHGGDDVTWKPPIVLGIIFNCQLLENCVKCATFFSVKQAWMAQDSPFHNNRFLFIHQHHWYSTILARQSVFFPMKEREKFWSLFVIGWNADSVAWTRWTSVYTKGHRIPAKLCPCNMSHKVQQVELRATCRGDKIVARFVLHGSKSMNSHEETCRCNMSLGHVPATFSCVCGCYDFVPATCPCSISPECVHHKILSLLHVAATCPCKMSPRVRAPLHWNASNMSRWSELWLKVPCNKSFIKVSST